jgi:hypothetical protein
MNTNMDEVAARRVDAEIARLIIEASKLSIEATKLSAETAKINSKLRWKPFVWASALVPAAIVVGKYVAH